ncbi:hypothetical protein [Pseudomonas sp. GV071]|jgi:hypothetical protein|uniref:hypothetical protein n=1 Tax=Pseudomonas sp. GV071 TaxID=2135754 RepID=UPI0011B289EC|nr:hypothetical protein [Pseudomonas sp. GV071]
MPPSTLNTYRLWKVFAAMLCCVITAGSISTVISNQTKAAANRYFSSNENPLKDVLATLPSSGAHVPPPASSKDNENALHEASKKLERIKAIGLIVDATAQLLTILLHALLLTKINNREISK